MTVYLPLSRTHVGPTKELCKAQDPSILATIPRPKLVTKYTQRMLTFILSS